MRPWRLVLKKSAVSTVLLVMISSSFWAQEAENTDSQEELYIVLGKHCFTNIISSDKIHNGTASSLTFRSWRQLRYDDQ